MKKTAAAAVAVLVFAIASVALASQASVTVTTTGQNYLISGQVSSLGAGHVKTIKILSNGKEVAPERRFKTPTSSDQSFWVLTKQNELPAGNYVVELVKVSGSKRTNMKFPFTIS